MKYKNDEHYNEYKFGVGLLKCYKEYLTDKDYKNFELKIVENIKLFKNSKYISEFFSVTNNYEQRIIATVAYITKDSSYFEEEFGIFETPEQKISFIKQIKNYFEKKEETLFIEKSLELLNIYNVELTEVKNTNQKIIND